MSDKSTDKKYIYKSTVKKIYGLTDAMIRGLGEADKLVPNPHHVSGPKASLYLIERVERWCEENSERLAEAARKRVERSAHSLAIADKAKAEMERWAQTVEIHVPDLPRDIWQQAERHYSFAREPSFQPVNENGVIAYVRHNLTNYESLLQETVGKVGCNVAYPIIKDRVNQAIRDKFTSGDNNTEDL